VEPSPTKADTRRVLIVPGPVLRTFELMVQGTAVVSPAGTHACEVGKLITAESKRKSPWKPIKLKPVVVVGSISVVVTGKTIMVLAGTEGSIASIGRASVTRGKFPPPLGAAGSGG
jgi:hypothetical protein